VTRGQVNDATGNSFTAVTDERGIYRLPVRVGSYQITVELQGFATVARSGVQLLVGQTANVNLQMSPSTVQETVTVTAEAPLLNVSTSSLGGRRSSRCGLPVNGRNWMALALLAPGSGPARQRHGARCPTGTAEARSSSSAGRSRSRRSHRRPAALRPGRDRGFVPLGRFVHTGRTVACR
jgi:hypothetical protein